jgi:hypothetical protein
VSKLLQDRAAAAMMSGSTVAAGPTTSMALACMRAVATMDSRPTSVVRGAVVVCTSANSARELKDPARPPTSGCIDADPITAAVCAGPLHVPVAASTSRLP